jgi:hypothetical protein
LILLRLYYDDDISYGFHVYELLILSLLVDAGMVTLANPNHIWSKGVIHIYQIDEGEVWERPYHILLALLPCLELNVNDYLVPERSTMS